MLDYGPISCPNDKPCPACSRNRGVWCWGSRGGGLCVELVCHGSWDTEGCPGKPRNVGVITDNDETNIVVETVLSVDQPEGCFPCECPHLRVPSRIDNPVTGAPSVPYVLLYWFHLHILSLRPKAWVSLGCLALGSDWGAICLVTVDNPTRRCLHHSTKVLVGI